MRFLKSKTTLTILLCMWATTQYSFAAQGRQVVNGISGIITEYGDTITIEKPRIIMGRKKLKLAYEKVDHGPSARWEYTTSSGICARLGYQTHVDTDFADSGFFVRDLYGNSYAAGCNAKSVILNSDGTVKKGPQKGNCNMIKSVTCESKIRQ